MPQGPKSPRSFRPVLLIGVVGLVVLGIATKHWRDKFPYSGTWAKSDGGSAGQIRRIHFSPIGACTVDMVRPGGQELNGIACTYTVVADKATIEYVAYAPGLNDRTEEERIWFKGQLTPEQGGQTLSLSPLDGAKFNVTQGNIKGQQTNQMGQKSAVFKREN